MWHFFLCSLSHHSHVTNSSRFLTVRQSPVRGLERHPAARYLAQPSQMHGAPRRPAARELSARCASHGSIFGTPPPRRKQWRPAPGGTHPGFLRDMVVLTMPDRLTTAEREVFVGHEFAYDDAHPDTWHPATAGPRRKSSSGSRARPPTACSRVWLRPSRGSTKGGGRYPDTPRRPRVSSQNGERSHASSDRRSSTRLGAHMHDCAPRHGRIQRHIRNGRRSGTGAVIRVLRRAIRTATRTRNSDTASDAGNRRRNIGGLLGRKPRRGDVRQASPQQRHG